MVNGERHDANLIVLPDRRGAVERRGLRRAQRGRFRRFSKTLGAEIVLLGTGARQRFPHPRLTRALAQAGIGLEVMDLQAACRTYNILVAEERKVAAALLFE